MKLKKAYIYVLSLLCLCVLFSASYYLSYMRALNELNSRSKERVEHIAGVDISYAPAKDDLMEELVAQADTRPIIETVLPTTKLILEVYDYKTDTLTQEELSAPGALIGKTREEVLGYLDEYMDDLTLSEFNKGLYAYELLTFSSKEIVMRKVYNEDLMPSRFYVVVKDGFVVVYHSDLKSVLEYTEIEAAKLPEQDRIDLSVGIHVDSYKELYSLLESFTS